MNTIIALGHTTTAVNCYCFNVDCDYSIFSLKTCLIFKHDLNRVMTVGVHCPACNEELIAKPVLEMKNAIYQLMNPVKKTVG